MARTKKLTTEKKAEIKAEIERIESLITKEAPIASEKIKAVKKNAKVKASKPAKKDKAISDKFDKTKNYSIKDALEILAKNSAVKFISSVELHINTFDKGIKENVALPFGTGRQIKVAVVSDEVLKKIDQGVIDFDVLIAEPSFMPRLAKYARVLGPKGLMPNPKNGTVTQDVKKTVEQFSKGQVQVKTESDFPIIHQLVGKINMKALELEENIKAIVNAVKKSRIKSIFVKTTMSPSLKLDLAKI